MAEQEYCPGCNFVNRNHTPDCRARHRTAAPTEGATTKSKRLYVEGWNACAAAASELIVGMRGKPTMKYIVEAVKSLERRLPNE